jgi:plastocyanin
MKNLVFTWIMALTAGAFATRHTINTSGFSFTPDEVSILQGDTIVFNVESIHTATEVSQSTWNANGTTSNGGFNFNSGNNQLLTNLTPGVHYYVCLNHASMGMKGTITVEAATGVKKFVDSKLLYIFPNPAKDYIFYEAKELDIKKITITSVDGKVSKEIIPGRNTVKVLISDLPDNVYLFSAYTKKDEMYMKEFVKE